MGLIDSGMSAIGRLAGLAVLLAAFLFGLAGVVYMSLQGAEVKVPEITGKSLPDGEHELASLGLKIKKRADRFSTEPPNTVIEQLPKPGETVKTGQLILVVTSKGPGDGDVPQSLKQTTEEDDSEKIEEMISDRPKKRTNSNTNRKKADTTRDVNAATGESNSNSNSADSNSNKKDPGTTNSSGDKPKANTQSQPARTPNQLKPAEKRPGDRP